MSSLLASVCQGCMPSKSQKSLQRAAQVLRDEEQRLAVLDLAMPPLLAFVPRENRLGYTQAESGWMLCRAAPTAESIKSACNYCADIGEDFPACVRDYYQQIHNIESLENCVLVRNQVEPFTLSVGALVICNTVTGIKAYGTIISVNKYQTYVIRLATDNIATLHRNELSLLGGDCFYFNSMNSLSHWGTESTSLSSSSTLQLSAHKWSSVHEQCELRRSFSTHDECCDMFSGRLFYIDIPQLEREGAARTLQKLVRQKFCLCIPLDWGTTAFTFDKPKSVQEEEWKIAGWAYLRRRSSCKGTFYDINKIEWEEYIDSKSSEYFYLNPVDRVYKWEKPESAKIINGRDLLDVGERVLYQFTGDIAEEMCILTKCRTDDSTGEDMYDVQSMQLPNKTDSWIQRIKLKRVPPSLEDASLKKLEATWILQIRRQRAAEERRKPNRKDIKTYFRHLPLGEGDSLEEKSRRVGALVHLAAQEELEMQASEQRKKEDLHTLAVRQATTSTVDVESVSRSEMIRIQRATDLLLRIQDKVNLRKLEAATAAEEKFRVHRIYLEEEEALRKAEAGMSSPRSLLRRKVVREVHRAQRRQCQGRFICDFGCKEWVTYGSEREAHLKHRCSLREIFCSLDCGMHMTEGEWLCGDRQYLHETEECPNRLVFCPMQCLEWFIYNILSFAYEKGVSKAIHDRVYAKDVDMHMSTLCPKRPGKLLYCRLGCGHCFGGDIDEQLDAEDARYVHEADECHHRMVTCSWVYGGGNLCGAMIVAHNRNKHRDEHLLATGVSTYTTAGTYIYRVPEKVTHLKIQAWGAGGGSGCFFERRSGSGGGGAFVECIVHVSARDVLELSVGEGGQAGVFGVDNMDPSSDSSVGGLCGVAQGGSPGGGKGYAGNSCFASGGGGGYTSVLKRTPNGPDILMLAGGGGGGGSIDGVPATGISGPLPGTKLNLLCGGQGSFDRGGNPGESGGLLNSAWPASAGTWYVGGDASEFGGGGGGGFGGGGGGGTSPGIAGGGGGGSSYINSHCMKDLVSIGGRDFLPGGQSHGCPDAVGVGDWDKVGGVAGEGGHTYNNQIPHPGNNGAIRISKPGFF
jgi:hypothetical protein